MPKLSRDTAQYEDHGPVVEAHAGMDDYTVNFVTFKQDMDHTPMLKGLPGDSCQCPHWGYVLKGKLTFRVGDGEEVFEAGDAFYLPAGHIPVQNEPGSEYLQFSPTKELNETTEVIMKNMEAMQGA
jgi:mannose-6-phosphate isomerase-like protein (cupin superfamily)